MEKWTIMYKKDGSYGHINVIAETIRAALDDAEDILTIGEEEKEIKIMCIRAEYKRANN